MDPPDIETGGTRVESALRLYLCRGEARPPWDEEVEVGGHDRYPGVQNHFSKAIR